MSKKKTRRDKVKYPGLRKDYTTKIRKEYLDIDYIEKLSDEPKEQPDGTFMSDKAWMNKFMEEDLNASFKNNDTDLQQDQDKKRESYNRNNSRNRDLYGIAKANELLQVGITTENEKIDVSKDAVEDAIIGIIDIKKKL